MCSQELGLLPPIGELLSMHFSCTCIDEWRSFKLLGCNNSHGHIGDIWVYQRFSNLPIQIISHCHWAMILNYIDQLVIFLNLGLILLVYFYSKTKHRSSLPLPPGPKKLPLLGILLDIPTSYEWLKYAEWGKKFSRFQYL